MAISLINKSRRKVNPVKAGKEGFEAVLAGADRQSTVNSLQTSFGIEAVFAFGQAEYYHRKRSA